MIKVGDKVKFKKYDETIYTVLNVEDEDVRVINNKGSQLMQISKDFIEVVEPYIDYKQRSDELEKQNDILKHNIRVELDSSRNMYTGMCEQKQRADRAEKRWEKLKEHFIKEKEQSFGILSWSRNNGMLELMHDLEEDGE